MVVVAPEEAVDEGGLGRLRGLVARFEGALRQPVRRLGSLLALAGEDAAKVCHLRIVGNKANSTKLL